MNPLMYARSDPFSAHPTEPVYDFRVPLRYLTAEGSTEIAPISIIRVDLKKSWGLWDSFVQYQDANGYWNKSVMIPHWQRGRVVLTLETKLNKLAFEAGDSLCWGFDDEGVKQVYVQSPST